MATQNKRADTQENRAETQNSTQAAKPLGGRRALVTGSTSGIGLGIARALAAQGCGLIIHGVEPIEQIEKIATDLAKEFDVPAFAARSDLGSEIQVRELAALSQQKLGGIDILINNAGIQFVAPTEEFPFEKWQQLLAIHLSAPFLLSQLILPKLRQQRWGRIVNIASVHGLVASANKSAYVSAKHGVIGLTKTLALETAGSGITCNAVCPGWVRTPLVEAQIQQRAKDQCVDIETAGRSLLGEKQPSQTFVSTDQLGALVTFLCSEAGSAMTGSALTMDGGWTAQ